MQITIIAPGSRGDVQPYVALGTGLRAVGHAVRLLTTQDFASLVTDAGLEFASMGVQSQDFAQQQVQELAEQGNLFKILARTGQGAQQMAITSAQYGLEACRDADLIVTGFGGLFVGQALSEKLGIPLRQAYLFPLHPTSAFPSPLVPFPHQRIPAWVNRASHRIGQQILWLMFRSADASVRRNVLHLPAAPLFGPWHQYQQQHTPVVYGYSPAVLPPPADWPAHVHVTGYWFLPPPGDWQPPASLLAFLDAGPPPVYIGFGSMPSRQAELTTRLALEALAAAGQRGILSSGWGGMNQVNLPATVRMVGSIPHSWLFPRMAAVVHHGGAGTTGSGLAAGVPSVVVPFFGDQPFWGQVVHALGVGTRPLPRRTLTSAALADAIRRACNDTAMQSRAAALGKRLQAEHGIERAVAALSLD